MEKSRYSDSTTEDIIIKKHIAADCKQLPNRIPKLIFGYP